MKASRIATSAFFSASALALVMGMAFSGNARATFTSCVGSGYDISTKASTATNCAILNPLNGAVNDSVNPSDPLTVNVEAFFSFTDWMFDGKWDSPPSTGGAWTDTSTLFNFTGADQSGTFTYIGGIDDILNIMFVFKDGGDTNLVGYLVPAADGTYSSPFTEPPFNFQGTGPRDISHISVYYRVGEDGGGGGGGSIPEPASLLLMGAGLMGLGLARRRKSA